MKCHFFTARRKLKVQVPYSISIGVQGRGLLGIAGKGWEFQLPTRPPSIPMWLVSTDTMEWGGDLVTTGW